MVEKCYKKFDEFKSGIKKFDINRFYKSEISEKLGNMSYLIIGSSSGLGRELAYTFAEKKEDLILVARDIRDLKPIKSDLEYKFDIEVEIIELDFVLTNEIEKNYSLIKNYSTILKVFCFQLV